MAQPTDNANIVINRSNDVTVDKKTPTAWRSEHLGWWNNRLQKKCKEKNKSEGD